MIRAQYALSGGGEPMDAQSLEAIATALSALAAGGSLWAVLHVWNSQKRLTQQLAGQANEMQKELSREQAELQQRLTKEQGELQQQLEQRQEKLQRYLADKDSDFCETCCAGGPMAVFN
jgi:uncharacterized protein HemX